MVACSPVSCRESSGYGSNRRVVPVAAAQQARASTEQVQRTDRSRRETRPCDALVSPGLARGAHNKLEFGSDEAHR